MSVTVSAKLKHLHDPVLWPLDNLHG